MIQLKSSRRPPRTPLSAMSDIGFLLLVFIMLLSLINYRKEVRIEYPEAKQVELTDAEHQLEIWIDQEGVVVVDGDPVNAEELEMLITAAFVEFPDLRIHILADRSTPYRYVNEVVQILQLLQHRVVSFVVKEDL
ncbi:biopolymer transporter ExbD [Marispirochaeta sp.]|uniref:ExbD/TolR family protein n=1 Tax=Marispirochaeta sp. TaxID=2038653 RepID=UPI0029C91999|nr:biopolymer transporter ExbD [Marispirochaeta sp.]